MKSETISGEMTAKTECGWSAEGRSLWKVVKKAFQCGTLHATVSQGAELEPKGGSIMTKPAQGRTRGVI
jgi:hypothetical protein